MRMKKSLAVFLVPLLLACASFAQPAPVQTDPFADPGTFSSITSMFNGLINQVMIIVANSLLPLPGDAIMQSKMCAATGNSLLDVFVFNVDIFSLSLLAAVAGVMFIAFMFMLGKLLDNKRWVEYAKNELFEIGVTIFVVLVLLLPLMKVIGCYNPFEPGVSTYQAAFAYPKDILASLSLFSVGLYLINGVGQKLILGTQIAQSVFVQSTGGFGSGGDDATLGTSSNAGMIVVVTSGLASLMAYIHELVTYGFVAYLLPLGLILRFFAPTRRIGGTLIALTFGMGVLVPFMFAIGHSVIAKNYFPVYYEPGAGALGGVPTPNLKVLTTGFSGLAERFAALALTDAAASDSQNTFGNSAYNVTDNGQGLADNPNLYGQSPAGAQDSQGGLVGLVQKLMYLVFSFFGTMFEILVLTSGGGVLCFGGTIYPLIVSIILISGVKYMSSTLGEEIDVSNLSRLI